MNLLQAVFAWPVVAFAVFLRGRFEEGIAACEEALRCDPKHVMALFNLALALERLRRYDDALRTIRRALEFVPPERLYPSTNCGMAPLSREVAYRKLRALGAGAAIVRAELAR